MLRLHSESSRPYPGRSASHTMMLSWQKYQKGHCLNKPRHAVELSVGMSPGYTKEDSKP